MIQVTVNFTEEEYQLLKRYAEDKNLSIEQVLEQAAKNINMMFDKAPDMSLLPDHVVLQMAKSMMDDKENERLYELQHQETLTLDESYELLKLKEEAWKGQQLKNKAMLEAQKRGLLLEL